MNARSLISDIKSCRSPANASRDGTNNLTENEQLVSIIRIIDKRNVYLKIARDV